MIISNRGGSVVENSETGKEFNNCIPDACQIWKNPEVTRAWVLVYYYLWIIRGSASLSIPHPRSLKHTGFPKLEVRINDKTNRGFEIVTSPLSSIHN